MRIAGRGKKAGAGSEPSRGADGADGGCRRALVGRLAVAAIAGLASVGPVAAQLMLPGAQPQSRQDTIMVPSAPVKPKPRPPAAPKAPDATALIDKPLQLNGTKGRLTLRRGDGQSLRAEIILTGEKLSAREDACGVEIGGDSPLEAKPVGRPEGTNRFEVAFQGCPITFDVLNGAILVSGPPAACSFPEADCKADPRGLWGPPSATLDPQAAAIEKERSQADKAIRISFKELLKRVTKSRDKALIRQTASEQAAFTARRETTCRDYANEPVHGFCAARVTEQRAISLEARLAGTKDEKTAQDGSTKPKPKPKPKATDPLL